MKSPVKMIKPAPLNISLVRSGIYSSLKDGIAISESLFGMSYKNWDKVNQPKFDTSPIEEKGGNLEVEYSTESKIYNIVDNGAPAHPITAKPGKFLKFRDGFKAKTVPGVLTSFSQPSPSGAWNTLKNVEHPGIEARKFEEPVVKVVEPFLEKKINEVMVRL